MLQQVRCAPGFDPEAQGQKTVKRVRLIDQNS
jgi:hypothetical protein